MCFYSLVYKRVAYIYTEVKVIDYDRLGINYRSRVISGRSGSEIVSMKLEARDLAADCALS